MPPVDKAESTATSPALATSDSAPPVEVALVRLTPVDMTSTDWPETIAVPGALTAPRNACPPVAVIARLEPAPLALTALRVPAVRPRTPSDAVNVALPPVEEAVSTSTSPALATSDNAPPVEVALVRLTPDDITSTDWPETIAVPVALTAPRNACPPVAVIARLEPAPLALTALRVPAVRPRTPSDAVSVALPPVEEAVSTSTSPALATSDNAPPVEVALVRLTLVDITSTDWPVTAAVPGALTTPSRA